MRSDHSVVLLRQCNLSWQRVFCVLFICQMEMLVFRSFVTADKMGNYRVCLTKISVDSFSGCAKDFFWLSETANLFCSAVCVNDSLHKWKKSYGDAKGRFPADLKTQNPVSTRILRQHPKKKKETMKSTKFAQDHTSGHLRFDILASKQKFQNVPIVCFWELETSNGGNKRWKFCSTVFL